MLTEVSVVNVVGAIVTEVSLVNVVGAVVTEVSVVNVVGYHGNRGKLDKCGGLPW